MSDKPDKDQKTEKPTPRRKKEARQQGQIAKSPDLSSWVILIGATYLMPSTAARVTESIEEVMRRFQDDRAATPIPRPPSRRWASACPARSPPSLPLLGLRRRPRPGDHAGPGGVRLHRQGRSAPKAERVNPMAGLKKLFSAKSLWETGKAAAKLARDRRRRRARGDGPGRATGGRPAVRAVGGPGHVGERIVSLVRTVAVIALIIAFADYAYQRRQIEQGDDDDQGRDKQELKNSEGDPMVKGKIRPCNERPPATGCWPPSPTPTS